MNPEHDLGVWEGIFDTMPEAWYAAPPSDAMIRARAFFEDHACKRLLDLGSGFGRWAQFLAGHGVDRIIGIDYARHGVIAASGWAGRAGFDACFVAGRATALPFRGRPFDGVLAALILDNLTREACGRAMRELNEVVTRGASGYFVFSPVLSAEEAAACGTNPTLGCTHVSYLDAELPGCLPDWTVTSIDSSAENLRIVTARFG